MISLPADQRVTVSRILKQHVGQYTVLVFGSRVTGTPKPFSDLDLAIDGKVPLSFETIANLRDEFSDSDLPFRVDIVDFHRISPEFQQVIMQHHEVLQEPPVVTSSDTDNN